jgi:hypothetical protein
MPHWLWRLFLAKISAQRPQASFLPYVEDNGTVKAAYQHSYVKTAKMMKDQAAAEAVSQDTPVASS